MVGNESVTVRLPDQCSADGCQFFSFAISLLGSINSTRHLHCSSQMHAQFLVSLSIGLAGIPSLSDTERRLAHAYCIPALPPYHELLCDDSSLQWQTLARAPQCLALSTSRDVFPGRSHVVPALVESQCPSSAFLLPVSVDSCSVWRQVAEGAPHYAAGARDLACAIWVLSSACRCCDLHTVARNTWFKEICDTRCIPSGTFLPHAVRPRLVQHPRRPRSCQYAEQASWNTDRLIHDVCHLETET